MKYIVYKNGETEHLVAFPRTIDHDRMGEALEALRFGSERNWHRRQGEIVGAGFIDDGKCHGRSETLGIGSRSDADTALLKSQGGTPHG